MHESIAVVLSTLDNKLCELITLIKSHADYHLEVFNSEACDVLNSNEIKYTYNDGDIISFLSTIRRSNLVIVASKDYSITPYSIGLVSLLRSITVNNPDSIIITDPADIPLVVDCIKGTSPNILTTLRSKVLSYSSQFDQNLANHLLHAPIPVPPPSQPSTPMPPKYNIPTTLSSNSINDKDRVLLLGSGGREHALACKLAASPMIEKIYVAPGNFGTGTTSDGKCENVTSGVSSLNEICAFVKKNSITLVVVGPEQPLVDGITDRMQEQCVPCFGPTKRAAEIEASKAFSKHFMRRNDIPTAQYETFTNLEDAEEYISSAPHRVVIKASGLAAGKGVLIPSNTDEALAGARSILKDNLFGIAGSEIVVEEFLEGEEVSVLAFCDGRRAVGMPPAQDHKRALDGDKGLNTGGMGAYAPTPLITPGQYSECMDIMQRVVDAMAKEERPFVGVLYGGFILTPNYGPVVLEFNCRFGDPETQVLLPLLKSDLCHIMKRCISGTLQPCDVEWEPHVACTVVCAAPGYPESYPKNLLVSGLDAAEKLQSVKVFHAGTKSSGGAPVTSGGRVLAVTGMGESLKRAVRCAYDGVHAIHFDGMHYRSDIAKKGLTKKLRIGVLGSTRGTDMQAIIDSIEATDGVGALHGKAEIAIVVSNKKSSGILERAVKHNLKALHIGAAKKSREEYDIAVAAAFDTEGVDIVLLIGYMRIVSKYFTVRYRDRCLNVHPSLLPAFAGGMDTDVHAEVIKAKVSKTGCTIHYVTEEVDGGPILLQKECDVNSSDTPESLKSKVQKLEGEAFITVLMMYINGEKVLPALPFSSQQNAVPDLSLALDGIASNVSIEPCDVAGDLTYKGSGVDIDAGEELVNRIKPYCKATVRNGCNAELGGFGGIFDLSASGYDPADTLLVSGTDGVGTKLKIAQTIGKHDTIGIDLVAMCANDILVCGAEPLFFLDYYATGALKVDEAADVVKGIAKGCTISGAALIGGETAEMSGMYGRGEYDLAGFCVGAVRRSNLLPNNELPLRAGDILIGLPSSGVHSNGYSLVRKCVERSGMEWSDGAPFQQGMTLGEALLVPTRIYVKEVLPLIRRRFIKALAHITGGGIIENLPRVLPPNLAAQIDFNTNEWRLPPVFKWLQSVAKLPQSELLRTFNCGVGMVLVVDRLAAPLVIQELYNLDPVRRPTMIGFLMERRSDEPKVQLLGELK